MAEYKIAYNRKMTPFEQGQFDMFRLITSVWHGKQYYFLQDNGMVYSRECCKEITFAEAQKEFLGKIGDDGEY